MAKILKACPQGFTQINNLFVDDQRVPINAKGLFLIMWRLPEDWHFNIADLAKRAGCGKGAIQTALNLLIKLGYVRRLEVREDGRFAGFDYILMDSLMDGTDESANFGVEARQNKHAKTSTNSPKQQNQNKTKQIDAETNDLVAESAAYQEIASDESATTNTSYTNNNNNNLDIYVTRELAKLNIKPTCYQRAKLQRVIQQWPLQVVLHAIKRMGMSAASPSINYLLAVLADYQRRGLQTLSDVQRDARLFDARHKPLAPANRQRASFKIPIFKLSEQPFYAEV